MIYVSIGKPSSLHTLLFLFSQITPVLFSYNVSPRVDLELRFSSDLKLNAFTESSIC